MGIRFIILLYVAINFLSCGNCEKDEFGNRLELIVPINTWPNKDTFNIGDTLWVETMFDKNIQVKNSNSRIKLDSFNFFSELIISEVSDTFENYNVNIDTVLKIGGVDYLPLATLSVYSITFYEDKNTYSFLAGLSFHDPGLYLISFNTDSGLFEYPNYDHPALYTCENKRRDQVIIRYLNKSTSLENYTTHFKKSKVEYLLQLVDFEEYKDQGAITIIVQ